MSNFTEEQIQQVWNKGLEIDGYDSNDYRQDCCNAWMKRSDYGKTSIFGWEIDHVYPSSKGGTDHLFNLRPMQWENNRSKDDNYPNYTSAVTSKDNKNIDRESEKYVHENLQKTLKQEYNL